MIGLYASFTMAVMIGFVNALAIMIFMAQVPHVLGISNMTYIFVAIALIILYVVPKLGKRIPKFLSELE